MGIEQRLSSPLAEAVRLSGGQSSFARMVQRNQSTVFDWLKGNKLLPAELCAVVEKATGVTRKRLRPDIFDPEHPTEIMVDADAIVSDSASVSDGRAA